MAKNGAKIKTRIKSNFNLNSYFKVQIMIEKTFSKKKKISLKPILNI